MVKKKGWPDGTARLACMEILLCEISHFSIWNQSTVLNFFFICIIRIKSEFFELLGKFV